MLFICLILLILIVYLGLLWSRIRQLPPGPLPILFLGNIPQLAFGSISRGGMVGAMRDWEKKYGKVFTLWIGPVPIVQLCDYENAAEVMVKQGTKMVGRWAPYLFNSQRRDNNDVIRGTVFSEGEVWTEHRRFMLRTLKNFGLGRNLMEKTIMEEFSFHCDHLESQMAQGTGNIAVNEFFNMLVGSIINRMLFGYRFDEKNREKFFAVKRNLDRMLENVTPIDFLLGPWCKNIPILEKRYQFPIDCQVEVYNFIWDNIERRKNDYKTGERILEGEGDDFLDAYFIEKKKRDMEGGDHLFDEFGVSVDLFDLWLAGQETTAVTLCWAFTYLLLNPDVIEKCRKEIVSVTMRDRNISLSDRAQTPYLVATINEIQRLASILNINLFRRSTEVTQCGDFLIPSNTVIQAQLSLIMSGEDVFEDPYKFNPERFLSEEGRNSEQSVIPFGLGKRSCLGESLARAELYLVISNLLQRYSFSIDPAHPPSMDAQSTRRVMHRPINYRMNVSRRSMDE